MRTLNEFIKQQMYILPDYRGYCTFEEYCDKNSFNENDITDFQIDYYYSNIYSKFNERSIEGHIFLINESLKSHTKEKLIKRLQDLLKNNNYSVYEVNEENDPGIVIIATNYKNDLVSEESLKSLQLLNNDLSKNVYDIIDFFRYHISYISREGKTYFIYLEPAFTKDCTKKVKENGNVVFHITHKNNVNSILKKGLRPKVGRTPLDGGYRYFPNRLFVINNSENIEKDLDKIIADKELSDYVILKIDLKDHNIGFYVDEASENENFMYTLHAIPPKLIEIYKKS